MSGAFVEIALHLPRVRGTFHYHLPQEWVDLAPGHLVVVPFGRRRAHGVVVALSHESPVPETRPVESLVDPSPVLTPPQIELARWISRTSLAPLGETLGLMLPPGLAKQADQEYRLVGSGEDDEPGTAGRLVALLRQHGPLRGRQIERRLNRRDWRAALQSLQRRGRIHSSPVLDAPSRPRQIRTARLAVPPETARAAEDLGRAAAGIRRRRTLDSLVAEGGPIDVGWLYAEAGARPDDLRLLERRGLIAFDSREILRDPLAQTPPGPSEPPSLTPDQNLAWSSIRRSLEQAQAHAFLLHGVTGSGKTEIYLRAVGAVLERGKGAIVLVPEISLTPQTTGRFLGRFPGRVGVLHSGLSEGERFDTWRRARAGELRVIIGPRSALFAPVPDPALIVVDEEHDDSYKESEGGVRYHARSAALAYARLLSAVCLLGSATPDVVTTWQAQRGELQLLDLPRRIFSRPARVASAGQEGPARAVPATPVESSLPSVLVVDMRAELRAGNASLFSRSLATALDETLAADRQAILFLNRRGAATHVFCRDCGWVARCPRCETSLTHHPNADDLRCHHCGYRRRPVRTCPRCGGLRVRYFGAGTQRVEQEVEARHPSARTLRWDWDVTRRKGAHEVILGHFAAHRADVLIGTQMLAKGLDLPLVTLVGVLSADTGLHLPDYRAGERTFQLLTQVAGRAGRGPDGGRVVLQTYHPDHPAIVAASSHDYASFYQAELEARRALGYPPFRRLVRLVYVAGSSAAAESEARRLSGRLRSVVQQRALQVDVIGPTPCFQARLRGRTRWQILLRGADPAVLVPDDLPNGWSIDVDPVSLL